MDKKQTKKEYIKIFNEKILPFLRVEEVGRKRLLFECIKLYIQEALFWLAFLALLAFFSKLVSFKDAILFNFLFIFGAFILFIFFIAGGINCKFIAKAKEIEKKFKLHIKENCLPQILKAFGDIFWSNKIKIDKRCLLDSRLYPNDMLMESKLITDDGFEGYYKNIHFVVCEYNMKAEKDIPLAGKFKGLTLLFELNKNFNSRTTVSTKLFSDRYKKHRGFVWIALIFFVLALVCLFPALFLNIAIDKTSINMGLVSFFISLFFIFVMFVTCENPNKGMQKVELEDVVFDKRVNVDAQDQIEARCHLTPSFIDKFLNLKKFYCAKKVQCAFYDNKLMFVINTNKNLFEIGSVYKSLIKTDTIKLLYNEINAIYEIIDYFKMDK